MFRVLVLSLVLGFVALSPFNLPQASAAEEQTQTVTLDVPGMTCKFCPITVKKALAKVPGVIEATSDFDSKTATVTFDPNQVRPSDLTLATAEAGYPSTIKAD